MPLDAKHRTSIYQKLLPILGEDDANTLMTEFPSIEADQLVTRQYLRAELAELRAEMAALEHRVTIRLGAAIAASTTLTLAAISLAR